MATQLIKMKDGTLVEVEQRGKQVREISSKKAQAVNHEIKDTLIPIIKSAVEPIQAAWLELSADMAIEKAEIELGIGFELEGNVYIAKSKSNANLTVKLILTPPQKQNKKP
jgi:hypothetical protein